ncbi:MAG: glycosyl transferase family 28 [Alphaproteobacteria bacterium]|nr:glycosyl transferase family 28 [Alphaproteobacteria bacterium]
MTDIRILFYVQHLLGIGHLRRAATLTRALQRAGLRTTLVSGGHEIPGLDLAGADFVQLDPTRASDETFKTLVAADDTRIDDAWRERRRERLVATWREVRPHVLIFELFPFGRRQMRFEILPLLELARAARERPLVVSSVRDILVGQQKPEREREMVELVRTYFDRVLVHGDPALIPFDRTFPPAREIADRLSYTGYVVDETGLAGDDGEAGRDEVLVSAGGGATGERLLATAIAARPHTAPAGRRWRILVGAAASEASFAALRDAAAAQEGILVERARGDFPRLLRRCHLSVSQGGYNTMMEVIQAGCRALAVPFAGGTETEQTLRAALLAERGLIQVLDEAKLSVPALAAAIDRTAAAPSPGLAGIDQNGAACAAALLRQWAERIPWR